MALSAAAGVAAILVGHRTGDCGCPEEVYLFNGVDLTIHFEPTGETDAFMDWGDNGEAEHTVVAASQDQARDEIFRWAAEMTAAGEA